jgi:exodeoxyribonuclease VII small subunit
MSNQRSFNQLPMTLPEISSLTFEQTLAELQTIVQELENGDVSLDESLARYERGMRLAQHCNKLLDKAEMRVRELLPTGEEANFSGSLDSRS